MTIILHFISSVAVTVATTDGGHNALMANDYETVKQRIIASVFNRRNATGDVEESYVCHLKIWEIEGGHDKSRYILLARECAFQLSFPIYLKQHHYVETNTGTALIHKSRLNPNGTFSVGKTWNIAELHAVEVVNVSTQSMSCIKALMPLYSHWKSISHFFELMYGKVKASQTKIDFSTQL